MPERLNLLLIVVDQHHAGLLGCAGSSQARTPNLDGLAAQGVRFSDHYTQNPICTPARVSLLSGQYCHNHGYYALNGPTPALPSFMHQFKRQGYRTAGIGKLHLPDNPRHWLADCADLLADSMRGPDGKRATSAYRDYLRRVGCLELDDHDHLREVKGAHHWDARPSLIPLEHCVESWITKTALDFLRGIGDQPFCVHLSYPRPHHVLTPDARFWEMYPADIEPPTLRADCRHRPPNFQAMVRYGREELKWAFEPKTFEAGARRAWRGTLALISQNDYFIGQVVEGLRELGRLDSTVIVYVSDHGAYHGLFGVMEKAPGICSDALCRVPSIWRVPGVEAGRVCRALIEHVDVAPTFCSLCGLPPMTTADGCDVTPLLRGQAESVKEVAVTEWPWSKALRWKQWRFVHYHRKMYGGADMGELYDIERDPDETRNLYHEPAHQDVVHECRRRLLEWLTETTRITTLWPYLPEDKPAFLTEAPFRLDPDGREPNTKGAAARFSRGREGSFNAVDYL
jgi:choline-sulfatase/uncharacterized sulfatase